MKKLASFTFTTAAFHVRRHGDLRNERAPKVDGKSTAFALQRYRDSAEFCELSQRTRDDYEKYLTPFEEEFGEDPLAMFQERAVIGEIRAWRTKWKKSPRQYDYAGGVVTTFLNWCVDIDHSLEVSDEVHRKLRKAKKKAARKAEEKAKKEGLS